MPRTSRQAVSPRPSGRRSTGAADVASWPDHRFENVHQMGGIVTGTLDGPAFGAGMGSPAQGTRVAMFNTGSGLRFTVALDRGGDIVDAFHQQHSLTYLSAVGLLPPSAAVHAQPTGWLDRFAGGLVTTCGPQYIGGPRIEDGKQTTQHGHHSNTPASIESLVNPDPHRGRSEMSLAMVIRDVRTMGYFVEVRRVIRCTLGQSAIHIQDIVTNRANQPVAHHWLYHVNVGYPLLDEGARFILNGLADYWQSPIPEGGTLLRRLSASRMNAIKRVVAPLPEHVGGGERGLLVTPAPDAQGITHVGIINPGLKLGLELAFPASQLPRVANWQHYGPHGAYVAGVEPYSGSLLGKHQDDAPNAEQYLEPGQSRQYDLTLRVLSGRDELAELSRHDKPLVGRDDG